MPARFKFSLAKTSFTHDGAKRTASPAWLSSLSLSCRVHSANKLAQKHERVVLTQQAEGSQCDICQEEKAIMFCSEDRALICRRCAP